MRSTGGEGALRSAWRYLAVTLGSACLHLEVTFSWSAWGQLGVSWLEVRLKLAWGKLEMILKSASSQLKITFRSPSGHLGVILKSACGQFAVPSRVTWSQLEVTSWSARDEVSRVSLKAHLEVIPRSCWGQVGGEHGATLTSARCHLEIHLEVSLRSPLGEAALRPATLKSFHGHLELGYLGLTLRSAWNEAEVPWNEAEVRARPLWGEVSSRSASGQVEVTLWSARGPLEVRLLTRSHLGGQRDVSSKSLSGPFEVIS